MLIILENKISIGLSVLKKKLFLRHNFEKERNGKEECRASR